MSRFLQRFYSSFSAAKSPLATLRKRTGFPIAKCREALSLHADKLEAAEKWLQEQAQKEGWTKAERLRGRATKQGHIGVLLEQRKAAVVEVNCETDFVAKNEIFKELVSTIIESLFHYKENANLDVPAASHILPLTSQAVKELTASSGEQVNDLVTKAIGQLSENIHVARGYLVTCNGGMLSSFVYNSTRSGNSQVEMGRYACVAHLTSSSNDLTAMQKLGRQICQQIVGDNPALSADEHGGLLAALKSQSWLLDPSMTVDEVLAKHEASVTNFVRCECGEIEN